MKKRWMTLAVALCTVLTTLVTPAQVAAKDQHYGRIPSKVEIEYDKKEDKLVDEALPERMIPRSAGLAESYKGRVSSVKQQNPLSNCWAFATIASMESSMMTAKNKTNPDTYDFSEYHMYQSANRYDGNQYGYDQTESGGFFFMANAYLTRGVMNGPVTEKNDPYQPYTYRKLAETKSKKVDSTYVSKTIMLGDLGNNHTQSQWNDYIARIKSLIKDYSGIYAAFYMDTSYVNRSAKGGTAYFSDIRNRFPTTNWYVKCNHAVTLVGWDDYYSRNNFSTKPAHDGAFLVKNSWGTSWGDEGFFWISYDDYFCEVSVVADTETRGDLYDRLYEYDPLGCTDYLYSGMVSGEGSLVYANKFKRNADKPEVLTGISTYFLNASDNYEVYVSATGKTKDFKKVDVKEGSSAKTAGFQVLHLNTPLKLTGSSYYVAVVLKNSKDTIKLPLEQPVNGVSTQATAEEGQSFYTTASMKSIVEGKSTLKDITQKVHRYSNVCLKAYTKYIPKKAKVSKVTAKKKALLVAWSKVSYATGYEVSYSTKKSSGYKVAKKVSADTTSYTISGLKKKKNYYVRVRAYRKVSGKTCYGSYSTPVKKTTK